METATTQGIRISVDPSFMPQHSSILAREYVFMYHIKIENLSPNPVQLLRRHWIIKDDSNQVREVEGEGVIGVQPILAPGEMHEYQSWAVINTPKGTMRGEFLMQQLQLNIQFDAIIPQFQLIAEAVLN